MVGAKDFTGWHLINSLLELSFSLVRIGKFTRKTSANARLAGKKQPAQICAGCFLPEDEWGDFLDQSHRWPRTFATDSEQLRVGFGEVADA